MKWINDIAGFLAIYFGMYIMFYAYNVTMKVKRKINFNCLLIIGVVSLSTLLANYASTTLMREAIIVFSVFLGYIIIFKEKLDIVLFKTFIMFVILHLCDVLLAIFYLFLNVDSSILLEKISYFRILSTILVSLIMMLLFLIKNFVLLVNKLLVYLNKKWSYIFLLISFLAFVVFLLLTHVSAFVLNVEAVTISMLLIIFFLFLCSIMIYQYFKNKHNEEEQENLLELMTEYEGMLDKDRINRHEMLNDLVALKSFKNKASKDFEEMLDGIIKTYEDKKSQVYSNLYKLPSGIKGIVYYRMTTIKKLDISFNLLISKEVENKFEKLNQKLYFKVCKILGIILDNAIEATCFTDDKILLVDIYLDDDNLVIYVENSFINPIDLNTIYNKGVSSKGEARGYGLYLVKRIVNETSELKFEQSISNDRFITIIKIKNPS